MTGTRKGRSTSRRADHAKVRKEALPYLTDEQWTEIVRHSNLPNEARPSLVTAITHYREVQARVDASKNPTDLRIELGALRRKTESLLMDFAKCLANADAFFAFSFRQTPPNGWPARTGPISQAVAWDRLSSAMHELQRLADWLGAARDQVRPGKPGAKRQSQPAYLLVENLNHILEHWTGMTVTRSRKRQETSEFVKAVCTIADPDIGDGTIAEAIKKQIRWRIFRGEMASESNKAISPRNSRDKLPTARKTAKRNFGDK